MKKIVLFTTLFASLLCLSQNSTKSYSNIYLSESVDNHFSSYYKKYVANYFYKTTGQKRIIERDPVLDTVAAGRSEYSVNVFKESSNNISFASLLDYMPVGTRAHFRWYDNPSVFKEPKGCVFPVKDKLLILKRNNLVWSSELFVHATYAFNSEDANLSNEYVLQKTLNKRALRVDPSKEDFFLNNYLGSTDHKNAIHKFGNWKFGSNTMFIISKYYNQYTKMWKYEVLTCHTIIIVKNYTASNVY